MDPHYGGLRGFEAGWRAPGAVAGGSFGAACWGLSLVDKRRGQTGNPSDSAAQGPDFGAMGFAAPARASRQAVAPLHAAGVSEWGDGLGGEREMGGAGRPRAPDRAGERTERQRTPYATASGNPDTGRRPLTRPAASRGEGLLLPATAEGGTRRSRNAHRRGPKARAYER